MVSRKKLILTILGGGMNVKLCQSKKGLALIWQWLLIQLTEVFWEILKKLCCPDVFIPLLFLFPDDMRAWAFISGNLLEIINIKNGIKQRYICTKTMWSISLCYLKWHSWGTHMRSTSGTVQVNNCETLQH